ncbi:MAG: DUF4397 domain-containing protein [Gemmatimonadetes bacterium]|nr:DUF4397 domain-containing protein [Gemmatimonadota bacterium]
MRGFRPGRLVLLFLATLIVNGCSDSSGPNGSLDAQMRYVNGISNTVGTVEIGLEGGPSSELAFKSESAYQTATPASRIAFASDQEGTLKTRDIFLSAGTHYTMVFVGHANIPLVSGIFLADDPGQPEEDRAFVRIVQGGLQAGDVDAYLLEQGDEVDGSPDVADLNWLDVTLYGEFASGEVSLVLTKVAEPDSIRFDSGPITLPSGSIRTLLLIDGAAGVDLTIDLIVLDDDA